MLAYDVLLLTVHGYLLAQGVYHVPLGTTNWLVPPPVGCNQCAFILDVMLNPPQKFLDFEGGKYLGPGALGFPTGIIPCNKYEVVSNGLRYVACVYNHVIVYEYYLGKVLASQVSLKPTLEALKYVPFITDPASPTARALLAFLMTAIAGLSMIAFLRRHELVVI